MSSPNVAAVQSGIEAWNRLDLEGFMAMWHPDAEWRPAFPKGTEGAGGVFRGEQGIRDAWVSVRAAWEEYRVETETTRMVGDDMLVLGRIHARGKTSGIEIDSPWSAVVTFQDGLASRAWDWLDHGPALEAVAERSDPAGAAGLSAEATAQIRATFGALNAGDLAGFQAQLSDHVEFTSMVAEAEGGVFRGHEGVRRWWDTVRGAFQDVSWELLGVSGTDDATVIQFRMSGTLSGVPVEQIMWQAVGRRDGEVTWWRFFRSEAEALEAVGQGD
jgi:ketosteroid isomerase-like protein